MARALNTQLVPTLEFGHMKATAWFEYPHVRQSTGNAASLLIQEGGVIVELVFQDDHALAAFKNSVASLPERSS